MGKEGAGSGVLAKFRDETWVSGWRPAALATVFGKSFIKWLNSMVYGRYSLIIVYNKQPYNWGHHPILVRCFFQMYRPFFLVRNFRTSHVLLIPAGDYNPTRKVVAIGIRQNQVLMGTESWLNAGVHLMVVKHGVDSI